MSNPNQDYLWAVLYNAIGNEYGVAGLMGNLQAESGNISYRLQGDFTNTLYRSINYTNNVDSGLISRNDFINDSQGYGLAQWTYYSRKADYYDYMVSGGYSSIGDVTGAASFLIWELQNNYSSVWSTLQNATSIRQASDAVLYYYENPLTPNPDAREALSIVIYNESSTGQPVPIPVPPDVPPPTEPTRPMWLFAKMADNRKLLLKN